MAFEVLTTCILSGVLGLTGPSLFLLICVEVTLLIRGIRGLEPLRALLIIIEDISPCM
jgi:hypothetical protein